MKMKTALKMIPAALLLASVSTVASAEAPGAKLFATKTCWSCHGKDAKTPIMPMYPKLAGQNAAYALQQMKDIKSGKRNNGQSVAMKGVMGMVNEDEMKTISEWLSSLK